MIDIQEVFSRMQITKKKQKDLRTVYKDALASNAEYVELVEKAKTLREKKKQIEQSVRDQFKNELEQLAGFETDLKSDAELLSDAVFTKLMKGEQIEVMDEYHNVYDPVIQVKFKKAG